MRMAIVGLLLVGVSSAPTDADAKQPTPALAGWSFGMSKAQVRATKSCAPYKDVRVTGGLECRNFLFQGRKINVSFVFRQDKLAKIQLWVYEGKDPKGAAAYLSRLLASWRKHHGGAESPQLGKPVKKTGRELYEAMKGLAAKTSPKSPVAKLQFKPVKDPKAYFTFASVFYNLRFRRYYVFAYRRPPRR